MRSRYSVTASLLAVAAVLLLTAGNAAAYTFSKIDIGGGFDLEITMGDEQKVTMTLDDNLWDNLEAEVHGSTLEIGWDRNCQPDGDCTVVVVVRELKGMDIHGAGDAKVYASESFEGRVSGVGNIHFWGDPEHQKTKVSGLGNIKRK